ncbi:vasorin b isoform X1 [Hemitrygon akajei]|uniref:vasorin b isoform X1 n=1 Tax=Hemitrygon akajei TaxID=2704970 RepID=UPI003BFA351B
MPVFPQSAWPARTGIPWQGLCGLTVLVLLAELPSLHCCPANCTCNSSGTLWCIKKGLSTIPRHIPSDTSDIFAFENSISVLRSEDFAGLRELKLLHLSHNKISELPGQIFRPLASLYNLDLSANQITEITNETFTGLRDLERLYLQKNKIASIQAGAFEDLVSLVELKLQDNLLKHIPPFQLPTLLLLDLSRNDILGTELGSVFLPEIESLKLAGLGLPTIDGEMFKGMRGLQELDLSDNRLVSVSEVLAHLEGLTSLSLRGNNRISQLQNEDFKPLRNLQKLDISGLGLRTIPQGFLDLFPNLRSLVAAENPYHCVCQLGWLVQWARLNSALFQRQEETRCHFPPVNAGRPLVELALGDLGCPTGLATTIGISPTPGSRTTVGHRATGPPEEQLPFNGRATAGAVTKSAREHDGMLQSCSSADCFNGGICQLDGAGRRFCACSTGFHGTRCEIESNHQGFARSLVNISQTTSTSVTLNLQGFRLSPVYYKGLRLTYKDRSGPDPRPVSLNIPTSLQAYSIRGLRPNSTYQICVGTLGDSELKVEPCAVAQTLPMSQPAPFAQERVADLTSVIWPAITGVFLITLLAAAIAYYCRRKRSKKDPVPGLGAQPYDVEGIKPCLQEGLVLSNSPKEAESLSLQTELPLIQEHQSNTPNGL